MSARTPTTDPAHLVMAPGRHSVKARPIAYAEVDAIAHRDQGPQTFDAYIIDNGGYLTPVVVTVNTTLNRDRRSTDVPHQVVYAPKPSTRAGKGFEGDRDEPVGFQVRVETRTAFRGISDRILFTSPEAEDAYEAISGVSSDVRAARETLYVADARSSEVPLAPVYGAEVAVNVTIKGVDSATVRERVEKALLAEFGDDLGRVRKIKSSAARDERVDVFDALDHSPVAINILSCEVANVMEGRKNYVETRPAGTNDVIIGG